MNETSQRHYFMTKLRWRTSSASGNHFFFVMRREKHKYIDLTDEMGLIEVRIFKSSRQNRSKVWKTGPPQTRRREEEAQKRKEQGPAATKEAEAPRGHAVSKWKEQGPTTSLKTEGSLSRTMPKRKEQGPTAT